MKKFYLLILTAVLLSLATQAQVTYTSILTNPGHLTLDDAFYWQGVTGPPPNPCNNCTIIINSDVTMVQDNGTSSSTAYPSPGTPALNDVKLNNCILKINGGVILTINTYVELFNTSLLVGSDATTAATVFLNDQADLNGTSSVQLANVNCSINANNDDGNAVIGPHLAINVGDPGISGLFAIFTPADIHGYNYSAVLMQSPYVIGTSSNTPPYPNNAYPLNCDPAVSGSPNACAAGLVFGPATTFLDPTYGIIFGSSPTLPVVLVQFLGTKNPDGTVKLSWATAQEINSAYFDVERSNDQGAWTKVGSSVKARGFASTTTNYSFTDQTPLDGTGYYRLKMVDLDAKYQYSKTLAISSDNISQPLVVYSNPFSDAIRLKVNVSRAQSLSFVVSDIIGKTYISESRNVQAGDNYVNLVPPTAAGGMYVLHIEGSTYNQTIKLAKQ
jgi:hypothetical protein